MRRGATPTNEFATNVDLRGASVWLTYKQDGRTIVERTNAGLVIEENAIKCTLTQQETLAFKEGEVEIQARYITEEGVADGSNIVKAPVERILKDGVIEYGGE